MITLPHLLNWIVALFADHGATHTVHHAAATSGWVASKHYFVIACRIPTTFVHGVYHCAGALRR